MLINVRVYIVLNANLTLSAQHVCLDILQMAQQDVINVKVHALDVHQLIYQHVISAMMDTMLYQEYANNVLIVIARHVLLQDA